MKKLLILILLFLLVGCYNYQELNNYAIVTGIAIDLKDNKYEVSILVANGIKKGENTAQVSISSGVGDTIYSAIKDIGLSTPKEIYLSHLSVLVINEEVAKKGLKDSLDFLLREPQSHQNFYMVIAKNCKAKDTLSTLTPQSDYPSQNIASNLKVTEKLQAKVTDSKFNTFITKLLEKGINPITNSITIIDNNKDSNNENENKSIESSYIKIDDIALFKKDKLIGYANKEESIGINMLLNNISTLFFEVKCGNNKVVVSGTDYDINYNVNKNKIDINIEASGKINEVACNIDLENPNIIKEYEKKAESKLYEIANSGLNKAKELNTDIFGFGNKIYKKSPQYFSSINDWDSVFSTLNVNIKIKYKITNKGSLEQTIGEIIK